MPFAPSRRQAGQQPLTGDCRYIEQSTSVPFAATCAEAGHVWPHKDKRGVAQAAEVQTLHIRGLQHAGMGRKASEQVALPSGAMQYSVAALRTGQQPANGAEAVQLAKTLSSAVTAAAICRSYSA